MEAAKEKGFLVKKIALTIPTVVIRVWHLRMAYNKTHIIVVNSHHLQVCVLYLRCSSLNT